MVLLFVGGCADGYRLDVKACEYKFPFGRNLRCVTLRHNISEARLAELRAQWEQEWIEGMKDTSYRRMVISNADRTKQFTVMALKRLSVDQVMELLATKEYKLNPLYD